MDPSSHGNPGLKFLPDKSESDKNPPQAAHFLSADSKKFEILNIGGPAWFPLKYLKI